jgi:putative flippase GtrA
MKIQEMTLLSSYVRYIASGTVATLSHFTVLTILVELFALNPTLSTGLGCIVGGCVNYMLQRNLTFKSSIEHHRAVGRYLLMNSLTMTLNLLGFWAMTELFNIWYIYAQFTMTILISLLNFLINRHFTFRKDFIVGDYRNNFYFACPKGTPLSYEILFMSGLSSVVTLIYLSSIQSRGHALEASFSTIGLSFFSGVALVIPVLIMGRLLYSERVAAIAALFTLFHPRLVQLSLSGSEQSFQLLLLTTSVAFLTYGIEKSDRRYLTLGILSGLLTFVLAFGDFQTLTITVSLDKWMHLIDMMPKVLMSPLFLFCAFLPLLSARSHLKWVTELPLIAMVVVPLLFFFFTSSTITALLPMVVPISIFGAAGITTLSTYIYREIFKEEKIKTRYFVIPLLVIYIAVLMHQAARY